MPIAAPGGPLFTAADLTNLLGCDVEEARASVVESIVWGWLKPVLNLLERPAPVPAEVFSWAVELGAIAHENPAGLSAYQLGNERTQYSVERRREILREAADGGAPGDSSGVAKPLGSFPTERPSWPDPLRGC